MNAIDTLSAFMAEHRADFFKKYPATYSKPRNTWRNISRWIDNLREGDFLAYTAEEIEKKAAADLDLLKKYMKAQP